MAEAAPQIAYPDWTEYRKKNGLDPPGNSNVILIARSYAAQEAH